MSNSDTNTVENDSSVMNVDSQIAHMNQSCNGLDRFAMFNIYVNNAIEQIFSGVSEDQYLNLFGKLKILRKTKSAPARIHKTMKTNLAESLMSEVNKMIEDENMKEKLEKLDVLVDKFALEDGKKAWRPNGDVNDHLRSHYMQTKLKFKSALEVKVNEREKNTEMLRQEVSTSREQVKSIEAKLHCLLESSEDCSVLKKFDDKIVDQGLSIL